MSIHITARYSTALLLLGLAAACTRHDRRIDTSSAAGALAPDTGISAMAPPTALPPGIILMTVSRPGHGMLLVDGNGRALYILDRTPTDTNRWRPVSGAAAPTTTDTAINGSMLGTAQGPGGAMQATYGGKPLYYYQGDSAASDVKGDRRSESGATGHLARPSDAQHDAKPGSKHDSAMRY